MQCHMQLLQHRHVSIGAYPVSLCCNSLAELLQSAGGNGAPQQQQSLQDLPEYPADFVRRRLLVFVGIVVG